MISVRQLTVSKSGQVICSVDKLEVAASERVVITGANGSGKSTLLRVLAGLEVDFNGEAHRAVSPAATTLVHQHPYMFRGSVMHNVEYGLKSADAAARDRVQALMQDIGIADLSGANAQLLSGGESRRVAIVRALAIEPRLLLLDEPTADLDESGIEQLCNVLANQDGMTIVFASPQPLPAGFADREFKL